MPVNGRSTAIQLITLVFFPTMIITYTILSSTTDKWVVPQKQEDSVGRSTLTQPLVSILGT